MKNLMIPTDFTPNAQIATEMGVDIAKNTNCKVHLVNFIPHPIYQDFAVTGDVTKKVNADEVAYTLELLQNHKNNLEMMAQQYQQEGIDLHTEIKDDTPTHGIKSYADENSIDLIVMGASHQTTLAEKVKGTKAERVTDDVPCPVLTVHKKTPLEQFRNIVLWVKKDTPYVKSKGIVELKYLVEAFNAKVHLAMVSRDDSHETANMLKGMAEDYGLEDYSVNIIKNKDEEEGILKFSKKVDAGLIVSFKEGNTGPFRLFTHEVSDDLIRHADIPVVTFNLQELER